LHHHLLLISNGLLSENQVKFLPLLVVSAPNYKKDSSYRKILTFKIDTQTWQLLFVFINVCSQVNSFSELIDAKLEFLFLQKLSEASNKPEFLE
jgi:hypothetical protein